MCLLVCFTKPHTFQLVKCSVLIKFNYSRCVWKVCHVHWWNVCFIGLINQIHTWEHVRNNVASRSECTSFPSPFLHGCIHFFHKRTCLSGFAATQLGSLLPLGQERLKLNSDSYWLPLFHRVIPGRLWPDSLWAADVKLISDSPDTLSDSICLQTCLLGEPLYRCSAVRGGCSFSDPEPIRG